MTTEGKVNFEGVKRDIGLMVSSLARNLRDFERAKTTGPKALAFLRSEYPANSEGVKYNWQRFTIPDTGQEVRHNRFEDFVKEQPPRGLGVTLESLEELEGQAPKAGIHLEEDELVILRESLEDTLFRLGFRTFLGGASEEEGQFYRKVKALKEKVEQQFSPELIARLKAEEEARKEAAKVANCEPEEEGLPF